MTVQLKALYTKKHIALVFGMAFGLVLSSKLLLAQCVVPVEPSVPTVSANICGLKKLTKTGAAPSGVSWYWQGTNSNGKDYTSSQALAASYTCNTLGTTTYYIRAKSSTGDCWSASTSVNVTITDLSVTCVCTPSVMPAAPPRPNITVDVNGKKVLTRNGVPPTGVSWLWEEMDSDGTNYASSPAYIDAYTAVNSGTYYIRSRSDTYGCFGLSTPIFISYDDYINWVESTVYGVDANGGPTAIASSKDYSDGFGNTIQSQAKSYETNQVFATENIYDSRGKQSLSTLPAPINQPLFVYLNRFSTNASGQPYSASDFDTPAKLNAPNPMGNSQQGTLGWYYSSANNLEPKTPVTKFPYARSWTEEGPDPKISKLASPGDNNVMGSQNEIVSEKQIVSRSELDHYFQLKPQFVPSFAYGYNVLGGVPVSDPTYYDAVNANISSSSGHLAVTCTSNTNSSIAVFYGRAISVTPGETYTYSVKGYKNSSQSANLIAYAVKGGTFSIVGPALPMGGSSKEDWTSFFSFTIPDGVYFILVGVKWTQPVINDQFYLSGLRLIGMGDNVPLTKMITEDPDGKKTATYVEADGHVLASALITNSTPALDYWSYTYYNSVGQVVATIPPNGVDPSSLQPPKFVTLYKYDHLGRVIESTSTDEGTSQFIYSTDGKIRFSQNQEQRNATPKRFSYTNYDYLGRLIESGEYSSDATILTNPYKFYSPSDIGGTYDNYNVNGLADNTGFINLSRKVSAQAALCSDYTFIEYDKQASDLPAGDTQQHTTQDNMYGQVSKTENANAKTWYSYDEDGQLKWTKQWINDLATSKTVDYNYDYLGNDTTVIYQKGQAEAFYHHYTYDNDQRLVDVKTSKDGTKAGKVLHATYKYYLHGPLKRVELASSPSPCQQGIDYVYTIDGALKGINHADPNKDPGQDGIAGSPNASFPKDFFGETLHYNDNDYTGAGYNAGKVTLSSTTYPNQYAGNLRAVSYNNKTDLEIGGGNNSKHIYGYQYDAVNRLKNAQWGNISSSTSPYAPTFVEDQKESVTGYDDNGNITGMLRKGKSQIPSVPTPPTTANYDYIYEANTNKVDQINHNSAQLVDYTYNAIGQMIQQNEGAAKNFKVSYNAYGMVKEVRNANDADKLLLSYVYDDRGDLLKKVTYKADGTAAKNTFYIQDASGNTLVLYEQTLPGALQLVEVPVYGAGRIAVFKPLANNTFFYEVSDHLGNVRAVCGLQANAVQKYFASMETEQASAQAPYDESNFKNVANTRAPFGAADHTRFSNPTWVNSNEAARLNLNKPIGPTINLAVSPGDKIDIDVWSYYEGNAGGSSIVESTMLNLLATAFGGVQGAPGEAGKIYNSIQAGFPGTLGDNSDDVLPKAFVQFVLYDKNYNKIKSGWAGVTTSMVQENLVLPTVNIEQPGYIYICVYNRSNSNNPVYFDDFTVKHTQSPVVAGADYYPFGLAMDGREITDEPYRYGYQGQFSEKDATTGLHEFQLRNYDARFGRWTSTDPAGQYASPYVAMGNTPNMSVDEDGGWSWITAGAGFVVGAAVGYAASDGDWRYALAGGIAGGVLGGASFNQGHSGATSFNGGFREYGGLSLSFNSQFYSGVFKSNWTTVARVALNHVGQGTNSSGVTNGQNCVYACEESFEQYIGGTRTRSDFNRNQNGTDTDKGTQTLSQWTRRWTSDFRGNINGSGASTPNVRGVISNMRKGKVYSTVIRESGYPANYEHNVLIRKVQKNTRTGEYRYNLMDPNGDRTVPQKYLNSVHKRHLILKP